MRFRSFAIRGLGLAALLGAAGPVQAEVLSLDCDFTKEVRSHLKGVSDPRVSSDNFSGGFRIDTAARTVTAGFTFDDESRTASPDSRFISDIRAMDASQAVFCEDDLNNCERKEVDTGRASGWSLKSPTVIDFDTMRVTSSGRSFFASASGRASISTDWRLTGVCMRN